MAVLLASHPGSPFRPPSVLSSTFAYLSPLLMNGTLQPPPVFSPFDERSEEPQALAPPGGPSPLQ